MFASIDNPFGADLPEHSSVGIYALASAGHEFEPTLLYVDKMGFRIYVSEKVSIDFAGGLTFLSGRKNDTTALGRMETPPRNQYKIESGIIYDMWGSSIHAIGLYGRAGILKYTGVSYASDSTYTINKAIT